MAFYLSKLALIAGIIAIFGQQTAAGQRCLALVADKNYLFNVDTEQLTDVAPVEDASFSKNDMLDQTLSPDRQHLVFIDHHIQNDQIIPDLPIKLTVEKFNKPIPFRQLFRDPSLVFPYHTNLGVSWSPDSHWVVYLRSEDDSTSYAGLADADGKLLREIKLPLASIVLDSWSADNRYIALMQFPTEENYRVMYLSVPDLTPVIVNEIVTRRSCRGTFETYPDPHCTYWSHSGHQAMYVIKSGTQSQLVVNSLDKNGSRTIDLGNNLVNVMYSFFPYWSPNDIYVALVTEVYSADSNNEWGYSSLSIYRMRNAQRFDVDYSVAFSGFGAVEGEGLPELSWTPDEKRLVYGRYRFKSAAPGDYTIDIINFNVLTKTRKMIWRSTEPNDVDIIPSPDSSTVAVLQYGDALNNRVALIAIDQALAELIQTQVGYWRIYWTPQGDLLVIPSEIELSDGRPATRMEVFKTNGALVLDKTFPDVRFLDATWTDCDKP